MVVPGSPYARVLLASWLIVGGASMALGAFYLVGHPELFGSASWFALDGRRMLDAADTWRAGGDPYTIPGYLYSPLATLAAVPFAMLGGAAGIAVWVSAEAAAVVVATFRILEARPIWQRVVASLAVIAFQSALTDIILANVTIVLTIGMLIVVRSNDRRAGIPLGIMAAAFPKPLLLPFLAWALLYRRTALSGAVVSGAVATVVGLAVAGPAAYVAFAERLTSSGIDARFNGNYGLSLISVPLAAAAGALVLAGLIAVLARRGETTGLAWAMASGIFLAPYTGLYAGLPLVAALPSMARVAPILALFAAGSLVACGVLYPVSGAIFLAVALLIPAAADPRSSHAGDQPASPVPVAAA